MATSELSLYFDAFKTGYWAHPVASECLCRGSGWALSEVDTWHKCREHYEGQRDPDDESSATCHCAASPGSTCICEDITSSRDKPEEPWCCADEDDAWQRAGRC